MVTRLGTRSEWLVEGHGETHVLSSDTCGITINKDITNDLWNLVH